MELKEIKKRLAPSLKKINEFVERNSLEKLYNRNPSATYVQLIATKLKTILGNPIDNPIMTSDVAHRYYYGENGLINTQMKYCDILDLQNHIVEKTGLPFIYDKFLILKMLQITLATYNEFIDIATHENTINDEDIRNIFADIDTLLLSERNSSAENGLKNANAIDRFNRYQKSDGGYGIVGSEKVDNNQKNIIVITDEIAQKKLHNNFGFSKILENRLEENVENKKANKNNQTNKVEQKETKSDEKNVNNKKRS